MEWLVALVVPLGAGAVVAYFQYAYKLGQNRSDALYRMEAIENSLTEHVQTTESELKEIRSGTTQDLEQLRYDLKHIHETLTNLVETVNPAQYRRLVHACELLERRIQHTVQPPEHAALASRVKTLEFLVDNYQIKACQASKEQITKSVRIPTGHSSCPQSNNPFVKD